MRIVLIISTAILSSIQLNVMFMVSSYLGHVRPPIYEIMLKIRSVYILGWHFINVLSLLMFSGKINWNNIYLSSDDEFNRCIVSFFEAMNKRSFIILFNMECYIKQIANESSGPSKQVARKIET